MKHVLLTRFAIRWPEGSPRRRWESRGSWLMYRMYLFKKYCLPSVQAQTFKDFDWWFLVDPTFPNMTTEYMEQLREYGRVLCVDRPIEADHLDEGRLLDSIYRDKWVCSTRLDSDDVIRNDFMERLHAEATEEEAFITFKNGYMLKDGKVAPRQYTRNPFVSYVEFAAPFRSVYATAHKAVHKQKAPLKIIEEVPGWVQVDHSDNVKNLVSRKMKDFEKVAVDASTIRGDFTWSA